MSVEPTQAVIRTSDGDADIKHTIEGGTARDFEISVKCEDIPVDAIPTELGGNATLEPTQAVIRTSDGDTDIEHTEEGSILGYDDLEIKHEHIPAHAVAELLHEIETECMPDDVGADDDLVGDEAVVAPCVVETNDTVEEEVCDEAPVNDNVDDSELRTDDDLETKQDHIPAHAVAELRDEMETQSMPDDDLVGDETVVAPCVVETNDTVEEEVSDEAPVNDNVDDSELRTDDDLETKQDHIPAHAVAELRDEMETQSMPDDDLVGDETVVAPCVVETNDTVEEEVCDEAPVNDNVDDSELRTDDDLETKQDHIPAHAVAELRDEMETQYMPDDDSVGDETVVAPCVVETNDTVEEEVCDEAPVNDNVGNSELRTGEGGSWDGAPISGQEDKVNAAGARDGTEVAKDGKDDKGSQMNQTEVTQQPGAGINENNLQNVKLPSNLCGYENDSETRFLSELKAHAESTSHNCNTRDVTTESKETKTGHTTLHSDSTRDMSLNKQIVTHSRDKSYKCDLCETILSSKNQYKRHLLIHSVDKIYTCDLCKKTFRQKHYLTRHLLIHSDRKPVECNLCNKSFSRKDYLKGHLRMHSSDKQFTCDVCNKIFNRKNNLTRHILLHSDHKPHKCNYCKKSYTRKSYLKNHLLTHSGDKGYTCDVCKLSFPRQDILRNHLLIHSVNNPHSCDVCKKTFSQKQSLSHHLFIHSGEKPYTCDVCKKSFRKKQHLQGHMTRIHSRK